MTRNLILSGGVGHRFAATSAQLADILAGVGIESEVHEDLEAGIARLADPGRFDLVTVNALRWRMSADAFADQRASFAYSPSEASRRILTEHLRSGRSLLAVHTAAICFDDWPGWGELVGAAWNWDRSSHPPLGMARVAVRSDAHPVVDGIGDFEVADEVYGFLDLQPDIEPLMTSEHGGIAHPLLWARRVGDGRVVYSGLGHDQRAYAHPVYRTIVERAAAWLVTGNAPHGQRPGPGGEGAAGRARHRSDVRGGAR